ncbi:RabGAP/TBC [Ascodesmis nigricans]|uniref:RabGAP/TBC n=1 Tax=Ascodesmis nigricans TaxID=341454 RepID=A0A4S2MPV7_9PEZI|nr:RabGAP/TBC [Ascodesmis nigricans]
MLSLNDARLRWNQIFDNFSSASSLKQAISEQLGAEDPCVAGLRSVCWKLFILYPSYTPQLWVPELRVHRSTYEALCTEHLTLIRGGTLGAPDIDPLAEDEGNPWEQYRLDVELRAEIMQDVERCMPDIEFFRQPTIQTKLCDLLMVYCKSADGKSLGYRQGLHELAAVLLWVVWNDAVEVKPPEEEKLETLDEKEDLMEVVLDGRFVENDTWALFCAVMKHAKEWYDAGPEGQSGCAPIVAKSKYIHEALLMATDPELAMHLKALDVLPQVFLIRWIRLLFSREFPFEDLLKVWDALFAEDTDLHLVDLVCVAMLLRIRWQLLEADYSTALTLVLRYPSPLDTPPATFVEDAIYLRDNLSSEGGNVIIQKYSKRTPSVASSNSRPTPPSRRRFAGRSTQQRTLSPSKSWTPASGIESIVQDVAKNVLSQSQRWGVNRAVRGAVEVRRSLAPSPGPPIPHPKNISSEEQELVKQNAKLIKRIAADEERQRTLARILELGMQAVENGNHAEGTRRLSHVKECLLDLTKVVNRSLLQQHVPVSLPGSPSPPLLSSPPIGTDDQGISATRTPNNAASGRPVIKKVAISPPGSFVKASFKNNSDPDFLSRTERPRTTLAQSSFAWMLGDDPAEKIKSSFVPKDKQGKRTGEAAKGKDGSMKANDIEDDVVDLGELGKMKGPL